MSYDGGCGDTGCELCEEDRKAHQMKMNDDPQWIKKMAELEDGCDVSAGGLEHALLLERLCTPGTTPPELDPSIDKRAAQTISTEILRRTRRTLTEQIHSGAVPPKNPKRNRRSSYD